MTKDRARVRLPRSFGADFSGGKRVLSNVCRRRPPQRAHLLDDGVGVDLVLGQQLFRGSAMRNFAHRETIDPYSLWSNRLSDCVTDSAGGIVVFNGDDGVVGCSSGVEERVGVHGTHAEEVDDADRDTLFF
jgi:hypothetical protein